jgi:hypothetical protein
MNVAKPAVCLLLPLLVTVIGPVQVWGQSSVPETQLRRSVPRDTETRVSSAANWRQRRVGQCTASSIPALELVTPPKHGTVRFVTTDVGVPRGSGCTTSIYGQAVFYRPDAGFVGQDQFTYNRPAEAMAFNWLGPPAGQITVIVAVRDKN